MNSPIFVLRDAIGFKVEEVALMGGWSIARQKEIEAGADLLASEVDVLSALLGADVEAVVEGRVQPTERPLRALLKSQAQHLDARARFTLAEASTVAREVQELRERLGQASGLGEVGRFSANGDYGHPKQGVPERLARAARKHLGLGTGPVSSVERQILDPLGIVRLWVVLPSEIDALAFASEETGAVIVCNPHGEHMGTAFGRRMALAHEVCHLLFDRPEMARFVKACRVDVGVVGTQSDWFERIERRARAFAAYLLAPASAVCANWEHSEGRPPRERVRDVMSTFGIGYEAVRAHLANVKCLDFHVPLERVPTHPDEAWELGDPAPESPDLPGNWLRAGELARLAEQAVTAGHISSRLAADLVRGPLNPPIGWAAEKAAAAYRTTSMGDGSAERC